MIFLAAEAAVAGAASVAGPAGHGGGYRRALRSVDSVRVHNERARSKEGGVWAAGLGSRHVKGKISAISCDGRPKEGRMEYKYRPIVLGEWRGRIAYS